MRSFLAGILTGLALSYAVACGGGGGSDNGIEPPPPPPRHDLLYGYFGDVTPAEVADHVNVAWIEWTADPVRAAMLAKAAGIPHLVLAVCWQCGPDNLRYVFDGMRAAGVLSMVYALYPLDEPDLSGLTEAQVKAMVDLCRVVASEYPELLGVHLWAIYGPGNVGMQYFDDVGHDCYPCGPQDVGSPEQGLILVPGGANPWRESPDAYVRYANAHDRVIAITPFLWVYPQLGQGLGIRDNSMAPAYRALGQQILGTGPH